MADRAALARAQSELLASLLEGAPAPAGFDPDRLAICAEGLRGKRADLVAKIWPKGAAIATQARTVLEAKALIAREAKGEAALEQALFDLRYAFDGERVTLKRGLGARVRLGRRGLFVGLRLPWLGIRILRLGKL